MKRLLTVLAPVALLVACNSTPYMLQTEGALRNTAERVVKRHDAYVQADLSLDAEGVALRLSESAELKALANLPQVAGSILEEALEPVAARHDSYVKAQEQDLLVRDIYLEDTARLRSIAGVAASAEPGR